MKYIVNALIICWVSLAGTASAQFKFLPDVTYQAAFGPEISSASGWTYSLPPVEVNEWSDMAGRAAANPYTTDYDFKSMVDVVMIGVNSNTLAIVPAYKYQVAVRIDYKVAKPLTGGYTSASENIVLSLSYHPDSLGHYNDLSLYKFSGAGSFIATITGVQKVHPATGALSPVTPSEIAANFFIKTEIHAQRYDKTSMYLLPAACSMSADGRKLDVSCYFHKSASGDAATGTTAYKPVSYELEWVHVDDYRCNPSTGSISYAFFSDPPERVQYDFRRNSTRIQLDQPFFSIPLVYESGAVVFRFRSVRPGLADYTRLEYGPWTLADKGSLDISDPAFAKKAGLIMMPHTDDMLNWQYTVNFAEQGKYKHVVNYFDGALKDRQAQTQINSDLDNVIAVEKVYDYEGRPALVSLPTPLSQSGVAYRNDILTHSVSGNPYQAENFDFLGCSRPGPISALDASAAAHIYYSPLNPDQSGMQKFVPDARGYPMVQTVYAPDNTGKVLWQGGAGKEQQLSEGHGTRYEYVRAVQPELDKFLGTEAGYSRFYPRQIVTDPNGQSSYSILNPQGKVVVSGLQSEAPDGAQVPIEPLPNFVPGKELCLDLLKNAEQDKLRNGIEWYTSCYNDGAGANKLTYTVKTVPYSTGCADQYLWLRGKYKLSVTDDCGTGYTELSATGEVRSPAGVDGNLITTPALAAHSPGYAGKEFSGTQASVPRGKILIGKKLNFSRHEADSLVRQFIRSNEPACFKPEENFIRTAVENTDFPCAKGNDPDRQETSCEGIRELMIAELFPGARYGQYQPVGIGRYFGGQKPNSIFTIIEEVNPASVGGRMDGRTSPCDIRGCVNHGACGTGEGCACTEKHNYPFRCCDECVLKECACISFPVVVKTTTVVKGSYDRTCANLPDRKRFYSWGGSIVEDFPGSRSRGTYTGELVTTASDGELIRHPYKTYYYYWVAEVVRCDCGYDEDTVWKKYFTEYPPARSSTGLVFAPAIVMIEEDPGRLLRSGTHKCPEKIVDVSYENEIGVKTWYRYQSECIRYPSVLYGGKRYTSDDIKRLDPQDFMNMFNREMAEALLPLHPEYCKLLNCEGSATGFEDRFAAIETYQEAEAAGLFTLKDIVNKDPMPAWIAAKSGTALDESHRNLLKFPYQRLSAELGSYTPVRPLPLNKDNLDLQVMAKIYCGAGNYEEMLNCFHLRYKPEIEALPELIPDPVLKQRYFRELQALYLANRNMIRQMYMDYRNSQAGCETCPDRRMQLIGSPLFNGFLNYTLDAEGNVVRIDEDENFAKLPQWKKDLYMSNSSSVPAEFFDQYKAQKAEAAQAEAEAVMQALKDCPVADRAALQADLKAKILAGVRLSPDIIRSAIVASSGGSAALSGLCNAFLVAYGLFPDEQKARSGAANFACGDPALLTGLQGFFNRPQVKTMLAAAPAAPWKVANTTISVTRGGTAAGNAFEKKVMDYFGYPDPASPTSHELSISAAIRDLPSCSTGCIQYVSLTIASGFSGMSLELNIQAAEQPYSAGSNLADFIAARPSPADVTFQGTVCLNDDNKAANFGLLAQKTAVLGVSAPGAGAAGSLTRYFVWNRQIDFMAPVYDQQALSDAINCRDIREAITAFGGADKLSHAYSSTVGHPSYERVLTNYLNYTFNRRFSYRQYRDLMEGCALGDQLALDRQVAAARIEFSSEADAGAFTTQIGGLGRFRPGLFRYRTGSGSRPVVLVDLAPVDDKDISLYLKYLAGDISGTALPAIAGVYSRSMHYRPAVNMLFTPSACTFSASVFPAGTATYAGTPVEVWENEEYRSFTLHEFSSSAATPSPLQQAELIAAADNYRLGTDACKTSYAFYNTDKLRAADYATPLKQAYLSYTAGLGTLSRSAYLAAIDPAILPSALSAFAGSSFSYKSPFCTGVRDHLYAYKPNPTAAEAPGYALVKNTILPAVLSGGGYLFPDADITRKAAAPADFDEQLAIIRKANGNYWYRYFDNTTNKMYNLYVAPPAQKMARALKDYSFSAIEMGPDPNTFVLTLSAAAVAGYWTGPVYTPPLPAVTIKCPGYADFSLAGSSLAAGNILLHQGSAPPPCFDTLDCEKDLLTAAVLNGKAAYYRYFEDNVARITGSFIAHLLATTRESLVYCGRQQQYQQTLYYYDRVGNLTRTVPPEGVSTLWPGIGPGVGTTGGYMYGTDEAETYRDDPDAYPADGYIHRNYRLTQHKKESAYRYNALNQLTWQQTPDGGVTTFFYDAAGRQIFSQSSRQRVDGYYTYNFYDAQGRPEESGQVRLAAFADPPADPDNTPYIVSYRDRIPGPAGELEYLAMHPDFIANAADEKTYPYEDLKFFVRQKQRTEVVHTTYDQAPDDLGAISGEMLSTQENLRSRVAAIRYYATVPPAWTLWSGADPVFGTHYSYDAGGNVKTITYDFPRLQYQYGARYLRVDYDYDLVSGKVNMISCNRGHPDQFFLQYGYDADNRITTVSTSNDGLIWNKDARYEYYKHGPLAKLQIGQHQVQSLEYAYTIQGWLKAINGDVLNAAKDMGQNGLSGDPSYPRDVIAHALRYFSNDYKPIGTAPVTHIPVPAGAKNLYNGNIAAQTTGIGGLGTLQRSYSYDQLQRLKLATNTRVDDNAHALAATPAELYKSAYSYDKDGNISTLQRWDGGERSPVQIDNFAYNYEGFGSAASGRNNRLAQVTDRAAATTGADLQPGQPLDNYIYDRSGNLLRDKQGAEHIAWDRFGKVSGITDTLSGRHTRFTYDGRGNRIFKEIEAPVPGSGNTDKKGEYYVRDAGGNILAVYRTHSVYDRELSFRALVLEGGGISPSDPEGTILTDVLTGEFRASPLAGSLKGLMLADHGAWVDTYTDRPLDFYWKADPTLRSSLLYSGSDWIDAMRADAPLVHRNALLEAGTAVAPLFFSAVERHEEGRELIRLFSAGMPADVCAAIWAAGQAQYTPGSDGENADALLQSMASGMQPLLIDEMTRALDENYRSFDPAAWSDPGDGSAPPVSEAAGFYSALIASDRLWSSPVLRDQNGPWTTGITQLVNMYAGDMDLLAFFGSWSGGAAAVKVALTPASRLDKVYDADPYTATRDMILAATVDERTATISAIPDITFYGLKHALVNAGVEASRIDARLPMASSGDTLSLAEHHLYGSSRLGVQRYDSLSLANIRNLPEEEAANQRNTLRNRVPWYSYDFADLADSTQRSPWAPGLTANAYTGIWQTNRTLGRKFFELSDHLGNVLATVLDRKTGATATGEAPVVGGLYDHWHADIAQASDYYPGGMMMPGRNVEFSWSRFGAQNSPKDDEVYGKGNFIDMGDRHLDTRILRTPKPDALSTKYPEISPYAYAIGNPIIYKDPDGKDIVYFNMKGQETSRIVSKTQFETYVEANGKMNSAPMPKIITGFEKPIYQKYDYNIAAQTYIFNITPQADRPKTTSGNSLQTSPNPLDPTLVKAVIMEESHMGTDPGRGSNDGTQDIMQANVWYSPTSNDWGDYKSDLGLKKGGGATPNQSIFAGIRMLYMKGMKTETVKDAKGKITGYNVKWTGGSDWFNAVKRYNGGGNPNYESQVKSMFDASKDATPENYVAPEKKKSK